MRANADAVMAGIRQAGFKVEDVRIILTTQAHFDHVGAHARLAEASGARVLVSAQDAPVVREGGRGDFHFGPDYYFPKVKVDGELHDGQVVTLGGISLTARITPGHTKGTTTWTMMARDRNGRMRHVVCSCQHDCQRRGQAGGQPRVPADRQRFSARASAYRRG